MRDRIKSILEFFAVLIAAGLALYAYFELWAAFAIGTCAALPQ
jgi:hypothetical protein